MILLTRTCFIIPLKYGALITFVFSTVVSLIPLTDLPDFKKISLNIIMLQAAQIGFAVFAGVFAITGILHKMPNHLLPFLSYYLGMIPLDAMSIIATALVRFPFNAHDLLKGASLFSKRRQQISNKPLWVASMFFFTVFLPVLRVYFTAVVYSCYEEMKAAEEVEALDESPEESSMTTTRPRAR